MHLNLHLTSSCNLDCDYCYAHGQQTFDMTEEILQKAIDIAVANTPVEKNIGLVFFGGEPLLKKELMRFAIDYCEKIEAKTEKKFHYKITTNGVLLNENFLQFANKKEIQITISIDGIKKAHDLHRHFPQKFTQNTNLSEKSEKIGSFKVVEQNARKLLSIRPYSSVIMTVNPDTVEYFAESVSYLLEFGFRNILGGLNYLANWRESDFAKLKLEYATIAQIYIKNTQAEKKFYIGFIDNKIADFIQGESKISRCALGLYQVSIAPDGNIYPCVQFIDFPPNPKWQIGDVIEGIDNNKRIALFNESEAEKESCKNCAIKNRCDHSCGCFNMRLTGSLRKVAPAVCQNEQILLPIVDELAEKLYKAKSPMFIQKHYNNLFGLISFLEDMNQNISH